MLADESVKFQVPLLAIIDYQGFRLTVMTTLPLTDKSLVYGSRNGGMNVVFDQSIHNDLVEIAKKLNLRSHSVSKAKVEMALCGDLEIHKMKKTTIKGKVVEGTDEEDSLFYALDMARIFPPAYWKPDAPRGSIFFRMLRPEFVKNYPKPLSSDALCGWQEFDDNCAEMNMDVISASDTLITAVKKFAIDLLKDGNSNNMITRANSVLKQPSFNGVSTDEIIREAHKKGINIRYFGLMLLEIDSQEEKNPEIFYFLQAIIISRVLKNIWRSKIRTGRTTERERVYTICLRETLAILNKVISLKDQTITKEREEFLTDLQNWVLNMFGKGILPDKEKKKLASLFSEMKFGHHLNWIIIRFCQMTGIVLHPNTIKRIFNVDLFVFTKADISDFVITMKFPPIFDYHTGVYYLEKARTAELCGSKIALYNIASERLSNVISYDLPRVREFYAESILGCYKFDNKYSGDIDLAIETYKNLLKLQTDTNSPQYLHYYLCHLLTVLWKYFRQENPVTSSATKREQSVVPEATIQASFKNFEKKLAGLSNFPDNIAKLLWSDFSHKQKLEVIGFTFDPTVNAVRVKESVKKREILLEKLAKYKKKNSFDILNNDIAHRIITELPEFMTEFMKEAMIWDVELGFKHFIFSHYFNLNDLVEFAKARKIIHCIGNLYESPEITSIFSGKVETYAILKEYKIKDRTFEHILSLPEDGDPLHKACKNGHLPVVKLIMQKRVSLDIRDRNGQTPLHRAISNGHLNVAQFLIENSATVDVVSKSGITPLRLGCEMGSVDIVKLLLSKKPKIDVVDNSGMTPLQVAIDSGNIEIVELLLSHGANPDNSESSESSLNRACKCGQTKVVELLLAKSANVNVADKLGGTPLYWACFYGHKQVVELLLDKTANINAVGQKGATSLHIASDKGHSAIVELLLSKGMEVNIINQRSGKTPLHKASHSGHVDVVEILLTHQANVNAVSDNGSTPLHSASRQGYIDVAQLLIKQNANTNLADKNGQTPKNTAQSNGHHEMAKLFDSSYQSTDTPVADLSEFEEED
eukprot:TRINITY_DN13389_c0_g1_i1.p1 TRINITY_DN13389_c0_g1~~TRINITY_DN13389_c0_g1_i1.p1  ORF type:complete len:1042 (+),score=212.71 TRINITY_DN13389_c0_g1_i1:877-4002(+)